MIRDSSASCSRVALHGVPVFVHRDRDAQAGVGEGEGGVEARVVSVVPAAGFFTDEGGAAQVTDDGAGVGGGGESAAVGQDEYLAEERVFARLLLGHAGME